MTAGLAGQNGQGGATAAENESLEQDEFKQQASKERAALDNGGNVIVGYDEEGNPLVAWKPPVPMLGGGSGPSGGSAFQVDLGNGADDWNENGANVTTTSQTAKGGVDFYVNSQGTALSATGYRYMDSGYAAQTQSSMSAPLSYFGFTDYSTGGAARNAYQVFYEQGNPASWSDASLKGEFDTLQLFGPNGFVNARETLINEFVGSVSDESVRNCRNGERILLRTGWVLLEYEAHSGRFSYT